MSPRDWRASTTRYLSILRMETAVPEGETPRRKEHELELMRLQIEGAEDYATLAARLDAARAASARSTG